MLYERVRGARMRKIIEISMAGGHWTTQDFAERAGTSSNSCQHIANRLVGYGYLSKVHDQRNPRGGRPLGVYQWTGKRLVALESPPAGLVFQCMQAMVSLRGAA